MKITEIDQPTARALQADIEKALAVVAETHGVVIRVGPTSFDAAELRTRVTAAVVNEGGVSVKAKVTFEREARSFGLDPKDLGAEFTHGRRSYKIVGIEPRRAKNPIMAESSDDGRRYVFPVETVLLGLGRFDELRSRREGK